MGSYTIFRFDQNIIVLLSAVIATVGVFETWKRAAKVSSPLVHMTILATDVYLVWPSCLGSKSHQIRENTMERLGFPLQRPQDYSISV